jgi:hypothetical protein
MKYITNNRYFASVALIGAVAGCGTNERGYLDTVMVGGEVQPASALLPERTEVSVRIVNAMPSGPGVDLMVDQHQAFTNVGFKDITSYHASGVGHPDVHVSITGGPDSAILAELGELPEQGRHFTLAVIGKGDFTRLEIVSDDDVAADQARLHVVNAAMNAGPLDIFLEGTEEPLFGNFDFEDRAATRNLRAGRATFMIRPAGERRLLLRVPNVNLPAGQSTTIIVTHPAPESESLEVIRVPAGMGPLTAPSEGRE